MEDQIDFKAIEEKWQSKWEKAKIFEATEDKSKKKYYILEMFPYPSGSGLHMGHAFNFTIGDVFSRFKKMQGFNVLHPLGFDSLGLPAENAAIKAKTHPEDYTNASIANFVKQEKRLGLTYAWERQVNTADPTYYKWDQWIFLKMFEKGLVYEKEAAVNWCPKCNTILANEQVQNGKCWRHEDTEVEIKQMNQWYFKITDYADRLLEGHKTLKWPEKTIAMQKNWIGKSYGTEIDFEIFEDIKDKEYVFLHAYGDTIKNSFWNWLKKEIESRGGKVAFAKDLPNTNNPKYEEQSEFVLKNYKFNEKSVVIGHSLGNVLIMKLLSSGKIKINKLVMVAPPFPNKEDIISGKAFRDNKSRPALASYCDWKFDFNKIKESVNHVSVLLDKKDHIVPDSQPMEIADRLGAEVISTIASDTHFNGEEEAAVRNALFSKWPIFTTRPDTIFGVTFMVVAAQHKKLMDLVTKEQKPAVEKFLKKLKSVSEKDLGDMEKDGVFTGSYAINPSTGTKIPIWAANFVIADYGSGMVMADAHDQRDLEFAHKYKINLIETILPENGKSSDPNKAERAFTELGILINSKQFDGLKSKEAIEKISTWLESQGKARKVVNYKLRDWSVARQRYWGTPIPLIHCEKCGIVPVPEKDLPVKLPKEVKFGEGNPLLTNEKWLNVKCPKCNGKARREANTMDTFVNSSWYFLRYCDPHNDKEIFSKEKVKYWMPIDLYIGGAEHACMHLIYCRFYTMFLHDLGLIDFDEPAPRLFHQGMINGSDGERMSKSKGNGVEPLETMAKYGVDTTRFFLLSEASPDKGFNWSDAGIQGSLRIIKKIWNISQEVKFGKDSEEIKIKLAKSIKNISEQIENVDYRKSTIELRELFDLISAQKEVSKETFGDALKILSPFCPHIAEELWEKLGNKGFISIEEWPKAKEIAKEKASKEDLNKKFSEYAKQIISKLESEGKKISKVYLYIMPFEKAQIDEKTISKQLAKEVKVFTVDDSKKYDPENKSKKARPGMPGLFVE